MGDYIYYAVLVSVALAIMIAAFESTKVSRRKMFGEFVASFVAVVFICIMFAIPIGLIVWAVSTVYATVN